MANLNEIANEILNRIKKLNAGKKYKLVSVDDHKIKFDTNNIVFYSSTINYAQPILLKYDLCWHVTNYDTNRNLYVVIYPNPIM